MVSASVSQAFPESQPNATRTRTTGSWPDLEMGSPATPAHIDVYPAPRVSAGQGSTSRSTALLNQGTVKKGLGYRWGIPIAVLFLFLCSFPFSGSFSCIVPFAGPIARALPGCAYPTSDGGAESIPNLRGLVSRLGDSGTDRLSLVVRGSYDFIESRACRLEALAVLNKRFPRLDNIIGLSSICQPTNTKHLHQPSPRQLGHNHSTLTWPLARRARRITVSAHQSLNDIAVLGVSFGAAMQNDDSGSRQTMPFSQEWHGHPPLSYTTENPSQFNRPLEFHHQSFPASDGTGTHQSPPGVSSVENTRGMTTPRTIGTSASTPAKGKRVRTGCLTCRERHLKCDEASPDCLNCRKRGRECKRGVRLNFLEINLHRPAASMPPPEEWAVEFQDESRDIASEYQGGLGRYAPYDLGPDSVSGKEDPKPLKTEEEYPAPAPIDRPGSRHLHDYMAPDDSTPRASETSLLQHQEDMARAEANDGGGMISDVSNIATPSSSTHSTTTPRPDFNQEQLVAVRKRPSPHQASIETVDLEMPQFDKPSRMERAPVEQGFRDNPIQPFPSEMSETIGRDILTSADEVYYMQIFVEEVGVWMDSFNKDKHFGRNIPYHALKSTMLLNALLACGVKHISLVSPENHDKALFYYNTATTQLLRSLQNPDRNTAECATTAIVLNVYEIMCEKPAQRMSHIAGSRALVRECGWNARSTGIGSACFWLNIGTEVLNCLAANWQTTWNPDEWGVDFEVPGQGPESEIGNEQAWVHRILYIVAKVANFRATRAKPEDMDPRDEQIWLGNRMSQWHELKRLCDDWNNSCPRTMHPFGYVKQSKSTAKSAFPRIWMIQREATLGRLLYHAAHCILSQTHPLESITSSERMRFLQLHHAYQVCGIVAHTNDRGVSIVAIRCLAIAGAVLTNPSEQAEVLDMLDRINTMSGWRLSTVEMELKTIWGWERMKLPVPSPKTDSSQSQGMPSVRRASMPLMSGRVSTPPVMAAVGTKTPVNPLSFADFKLPNHPYQNWYEPPNRTGSFNPPSL